MNEAAENPRSGWIVPPPLRQERLPGRMMRLVITAAPLATGFWLGYTIASGMSGST